MSGNPSDSSSQPPADAFDGAGILRTLLWERHSCRAYLPDPVPAATIERILEFAQRTASWCNTQPWRVIVTSGAASERLRQAMYRHAASKAEGGPDFPFPQEYRGVALARRRESGFQLFEALGIAREDLAARDQQTLENFRFFGAPHVAIITTDALLGVYGTIDCGGYISNFMLAAHAHGVATIALGAVANCASIVREQFDLPSDRLVVCGIAFGFADRTHPVNSYRTSRAALAEAVSWNDK